MPHQRTDARALLSERISGRRLIRLQSLFDRAFDSRLATRFQSMSEFRAALQRVPSPDSDDSNFDALVGQLDEAVTQRSHVDAITNAAKLRNCFTTAIYVIDSFAKSKNLECAQTGGPSDYSAPIPFCTVALAMVMPSTTVREFVSYRFELRGNVEIVLIVADEEVWRGSEVSAFELAVEIQRPAIELYLRQNHGEPLD